MENEARLRQLLTLQHPPLTFQFEKMLRRFLHDPRALHLEGINPMSPNRPEDLGFAVAMQTRFMYDLEPQFGLDPPRYYYINAEFLGADILSDEARYDGVRFYFGLEKTKGENRLTLILTKVNAITFDKSSHKDIFTSEDHGYFIPNDFLDGNWRKIEKTHAKKLKDNLREIVREINKEGKDRYKNDGYFMGRDALRNVLSKSKSDEFNIEVSWQGIKLYFGLLGNKKNLPYNYENESPDDKELQLILVGMDDSDLGPLASFSNIYASLETDVIEYVEGVKKDLPYHRMLGGDRVEGGNCIATTLRYPPINPI